MHRRLRVPSLAILPAVAFALLAVPGVVVADVPAGTWTITGIELNGTHIDANGTIGFTDTGFGATVGCNSIGGQASVDENGILTFSGMSTTLIGCPKDLATAEDALMKILSGGPIDITGSQWSNAMGEIDVAPNDAGGAGDGGAVCIPPVAPGANPGNVTVPCGNGGSSGSGSANGVGQDVPPADSLDATTLVALAGVAILVIATIGAFIYLNPRRASGGGEE